MWSLRNIYLYLVCFVSLMLIISGLIGSLGSLTDIFFPQDYSYTNMMPAELKEGNANLTPEQIKDRQVQIEKQNEQNKINQRNQRINSSLRGIIMVVIALPFYIYHWKKIEASQPKQEIKEINA